MNRKQRKAMNDIKKQYKEIRNNRRGMSPLTTLTMIFVVLKCTNNIDWSWVYVLSPLWMPFGLVIILALLVSPVLVCLSLNKAAYKLYKKWSN